MRSVKSTVSGRGIAGAAAAVLALAIASGVAAKTVTLNVWSVDGYSPNREVFIKAVQDFEKAHPGIRIKVNYGDWVTLSEKFLTATAGGAAPDLFNTNLGGNGELVWGNLFRALDPYISKDRVKKSDYIESTLDALTVDGKLYGLPTHTDARGIIFNKALFAKAGLDTNAGPKTWDDLKEYQMKLTQKPDGRNFSQVGILPFAGEAAWIFQWGWMLGGSSWDVKEARYTLENPKNVQALKYLISLATVFGPEFLANGPKVGGIAGGKVAMEVGGSWYLPYLAKSAKGLQFGVYDLPYPVEGVRATLGGGFAWSIARGSKRPDEAWQFVKWMAGYEGQTRLFPGIGAVPANLAAQKHVFAEVDANAKAFFEMTSYVKQFPNYPGSLKLLTAQGPNIMAAYQGKLQPEEALKRSQVEAQRLWTAVAKRKK